MKPEVRILPGTFLFLSAKNSSRGPYVFVMNESGRNYVFGKVEEAWVGGKRKNKMTLRRKFPTPASDYLLSSTHPPFPLVNIVGHGEHRFHFLERLSATLSAINLTQHSAHSHPHPHHATWTTTTHPSLVFWLMTLSFGGLGLLYPWSPTLLWDHTRAGFRSFICALVVLAVLLILGEHTPASPALPPFSHPHQPTSPIRPKSLSGLI